jgi:hypothetical protein
MVRRYSCLDVAATGAWHIPSLMYWTGTQHEEGFAYYLLMISLVLTGLMVGAGVWLIDRALADRTPRSRAQNKGFVAALCDTLSPAHAAPASDLLQGSFVSRM